MLSHQIQLASRFKIFENGDMADFSDRLTYKFSCLIMVLFGGILLFKQYWTQSISCFIAVSPGGSHLIEYIESYCYVHGIIPISFNGTFPSGENDWREKDNLRIQYYQWVPFVLFAQAVLCYLPQILWMFSSKKQNSTDFKHILQRANKAVELDDEKRKSEVIHLAKALEKLLFQNRNQSSKSLFQIKAQNIQMKIKEWIKVGMPLAIYYVIIKILYVVNSIGQIFLMQSFLHLNKSDYKFFGSKILNDIVSGRDWQVSMVLPRVGFCFAKIRHLGTTNYVTAQCAIPINMLNEKIYIFLWFWMLFLSITSIISLIVWIIRISINQNKTDFLKMYLKLSGDFSYKELKNTSKIKKFENRFLSNDGVFFLRILASNVGDLITAEVVSQLWKIYEPSYEDKELNMVKLENFITCKKRNNNDGTESRRVSI